MQFPFKRAWIATIAITVTSACGGAEGEPTTAAGSGAEGPTSSASGSGASSNSGAGPTTGSGAGASTSASSGSGGNLQVGPLTDDFAGDGPLEGYVTNNPGALPDVARVDGRYRANLTNNRGDVTLHFNDSQGRLDAKPVTFPFEVIARNIGIGTQSNAQQAPSPSGNPYIFAGVQVHVENLDEPTSAHVVVGHRGPTAFTVEGKNTVSGDSTVNDVGANVVPAGRADIRIVGNADRTLTVSWQTPNPSPGSQADDWNLYNGDGSLPGSPPPFGETVYVGLITYAFGYGGIPFVGTCDALEGGPQ